MTQIPTPEQDLQLGDPMDITADPPTNTPELQTNHKANNPFKNLDSSTSPDAPSNPGAMESNLPHFPYVATTLSRDILELLPFKTSNRILDDVRLSPLYFAARPKGSLLRSKPFDYRHVVSSTLARLPSAALILNNSVPHVPSVSKVAYPEDSVTVTSVRGLIVGADNTNLHHFRIQSLTTTADTLVHSSVPKQEYHLLSKEMVSVDDLNYLDEQAVNSENLVDDAIYKSANSATNHLLRVSIYTAEFSAEDLVPITDAEVIKTRYLKGIENSKGSLLSTKSTPTPLHCIRTLLKVLKGPVLLPAGEAIHTIDRELTNLDAQIDTSILFEKFGFKTGEEENKLVPPDLSANHGLKEAYIRKAYELIYLGKQLKIPGQTNEFDTQYSFNDKFSQVFVALGEVDKAASMSMSSSERDQTNKLNFYVALSAYSVYSEELIIKCFENTVLSDPQNKLHYVDFFKKIIANRPYDSQKLQTYHNNQYLKGFMYGLQDYQNALRVLGIEGAPEDSFVDEGTIIELYKVACRNDYKNYTYFNKQLRIIAEIQNSSGIEKFLREEMVSPLAAIQELRIEEATEDEVVITAFEIRLDEVMQAVNFNTTSPEIIFLQKCLVSIATVRRSFLLMAYIESNMPELVDSGKTLAYTEALDLLGVPDATPDLDIINIFEDLTRQVDIDEPAQFRDLRVALKTIATDKKLKILNSYIRTGRVDASLLPPQNWPAGLDNIGNTCYLNSLLQYYFCIKPLRDMILTFDETTADFSKSAERKIGGRLVETLELERSFQFVHRLRHLFEEMIHTRRRCVQPSKELAYLSFLPLSQPVTFKSNEKEVIEVFDMDVDGPNAEFGVDTDVASMEVLDGDNLDTNDSEAIEILDSDAPATTVPGIETPDLQVSNVEIPNIEDADLVEIETPLPTAETKEQTKIMSIGADQIESAIEIGRQQDVTECIENVTFQLETALEPISIEDDGEQYDLIKQLFCGKTKQTITPLDDLRPPRSTMERFFSLIINISDHPKDIYDALDNYFSESTVDLEEGTVKMCLTVMKLPEILQFHVQRVLFDRERLVAYKSLEAIPFSETVYLDRYLDTEDEEILHKRHEVSVWKEEIKNLYVERDAVIKPDPTTKLSIIDSLRATIKYLTNVVQADDQLTIKQETIDAIQMQLEMIQAKLQAINTRISKLQHQVSEQFENYKKVGYTLFAIFIHRGEASHGHYWIYIRDMKKNIYRKYNDDTVTEVPVSEVLNFAEGNTATPYYMVYVKEELKSDYIEPLRREIADEPDFAEL